MPIRPLAALALFALLAPPAAAAPPRVPVQGVLTDADGVPVDGTLDVTFSLYADAAGQDRVWTETRPVDLAEGLFSAYLGTALALDLALFRDHPALWLGVSVDGDDEMPLVELATAPYAAFAAHAGDAETLGGVAAGDLARAAHRHDIGDLDGLPAGLADGDDDTLYAATEGGGLLLQDGNFGLLQCPLGDVLARGAEGWVCAPNLGGDAAAARISEIRLEGTLLIIAEGDHFVDVDLGPLGADSDADSANELLQRATLEGTTLALTDAGGTLRVDLSALGGGGEGDATDELNEAASLEGAMLAITDAGGTLRVDLASLRDDADADAANELIQRAALNGAFLELTDAGGMHRVDLSSLMGGGAGDADADPQNELLQAAALQGTTLRLTDAGGDLDVNLDPLRPRALWLAGTTLSLDLGDRQLSTNLAALVNDADSDPRNEVITNIQLNGTVLTLTDVAGAHPIDLASLRGGGDDADADPANEIQALAIDGQGNLSISGANTVNVHQGAFALSVNLGRSEDDIAFPDTFGGDDDTRDVDLPFAVTYGGVAYSRVRVSTNGWLELGNSGSSSDLGNRCLPASGHDGPFVAAYWDDLISTVSWATEGSAPNRVFAVRYDATLFGAGSPVDFLVQIHEGSGAISVRYFGVDPGTVGASATIGFQSAGAQNAKAYAIGCNVAVLDDNANDADPDGEGWSIAPIR